MRLKVRLTVRADIGESTREVTVQQRIPVEFHVQWKQCPACNREFTNRTWHALVQLRQKRQDDSKKALALVEAALARNQDVRKHVLSVDTSRNGFDFYFMELMHANSFTAYLSTVYPMKVKTVQKVVSENANNNTANIKHTTVCDMVPLNRYDLIVCDKRAAKEGCGPGRLNGRMCVVHKVSSGSLHLVDASPARTNIEDCFADLYPEKYWKGDKHFRIVFSQNRLVRFVVMDVELCDEAHERGENNFSKYSLADVTVARESDVGISDETFHCTTHLGNILEIGDVVLGYDLVSSVLTGGGEWSMNNSFNSSFTVPDIVLVKKVSGGAAADEIAPVDESSNKKKAKSSASKRKERRKEKQEKKMKEVSESLGRMGFGGGGGGEGDNDNCEADEIED
jgi:nonsense-mediated mRNA decay protein 3